MQRDGGTGGARQDDAASQLNREVLRASVSARLFGEEAAVPISLGPYRLLGPIGAGGMGVVFEARDERSGQRLAIKVLRRGAAEMAMLKREFRVVADLHHPNLVQLYELSVQDGLPYLVMELVEGRMLLQHVRREGALDCAKVWAALRQLVDAVSTLHAAGVLHRDIKPSNVLIQSDGRLVVLDFGLALPTGGPQSMPLAGTPRYMAPERRLGEAASQASDWYSVGVMLLEALVGHAAIVEDSVAGPPAFVTDLHLSDEEARIMQFCFDLLHGDPARRRAGAELRVALGLPEQARPASPLRPLGASSVFVGREHELQCLRDALATAREGGCVLVHVRGEPGIGKTALVKQFIAERRLAEDATVLENRCHEGELVPFNAADGLIDALASELLSLPEDDRRVTNRTELLRLFPALRPALVGAEPSAAEPVSVDPHAVRQRAFEALRSLVHALASRRLVLVHIDDLQWGDADSAQLLRELLCAPAPMLFVASYRDTSADLGDCVHVLRGLGDRLRVHDLVMGPLPQNAAMALARALAADDASDEELQRISADARGNPLFLRAVLEHWASSAVRPERRSAGLQDVLQAALARLPAANRELLELVAVATRPVQHDLLLRAAAHAEAQAPSWLDQLASLQRTGLVRVVPDRHALETYHDRIRETVTALIAPDVKRRHHAHLAAAEVLSAVPDAEFLACHYEAAGQLVEAARSAELAGDRALAAVALDSAAKQYAAALRCRGGDRPPGLVRKLADAIAYTGRCGQAVSLYLEAARALEGQPALELRLRAVEMLLRSGRLQEGVETAKPVLKAVRLRYPRTALGAFASVLVNMQRLRMRDLATIGPRRTTSDADRFRAEVCFSMGYRLIVTDTIRACSLLSSSLVLALESGSDAQRARALACYALLLAFLDRAQRAEQEQLFDRAWQLACAIDDADTKGWVLFLRSVMSFARGDFSQALDRIDVAQRWIAAHCVDTGWLVNELDLGRTAQLFLIGRLARLAEVSPGALQRCRETGNDYNADWIRVQSVFVAIARDEPQRALEVIDHALSRWNQEDLYQPVPTALWIRAHVLLYRGEASAAWLFVCEHWPRYVRARYDRAQPWNVGLPLVEATVALACAQARPTSRLLRAIRRAISALRARRADWAHPSRLLVEAGLAHVCGDRARAADLYGTAADRFDEIGLCNYAAAARVRLADLSSGSAAERQRAQADAWFRREGVVNPECWTRMYAPVCLR